MSEHAAVSKVTAQTAEHSGALGKLIVFSLTLALAPISSYFISERYLWNGNSTYAAITAILAANAVLIAYIIVSVREDSQQLAFTPPEKVESRKMR